MFFSDIITHGILIIRSSSKQLVTWKGLCILEFLNLYFLHSIFLLLNFTNHEPIVCRHHYYVVIWIFYNKHIKLNVPSNFFKGYSWSSIYLFYNWYWFHIQNFLLANIYYYYLIHFHITFSKTYQKPFNTKKTIPIINFFPDPHNGFAILHINIMVDVSSHLRNSRLNNNNLEN